MDHSVPKHAICTQWKRAVARWWVEHGRDGHEFTFRTAVDIDFVNYLLFSIEPDARWGAPMVCPRCYLSAHHCNCHKAELEHCRMIGLSDFAQLNLDPLGVHEVDGVTALNATIRTIDGPNMEELLEMASQLLLSTRRVWWPGMPLLFFQPINAQVR